MSCTSDDINFNIDLKGLCNKLLQSNPFTPEQLSSKELRSFDMANDCTLPRKRRRMFKRKKQCMNKERCCGNCHWFDNEDTCGVGWCCNNEHESSCDLVCDDHEF